MDVSEEDSLQKELFTMALIVPEQSQRPYRFGMTLLCIGALFNWLGLADSYTEPVPAVRYIGVALIAVGAALICLAMCCWMRAVQDPQVAREVHNRENVAVQAINMEQPDPRSLEKPPDYSSVVDFPPSYEDAVRELDANKLLYTCPLNNNYQDLIKKEDDIVLIISQLDGTDGQTDNQDDGAQQKLADFNEEKDVMETAPVVVVVNGITPNENVIVEKIKTNNASPTIQQTHSIVEISESMSSKTTSQSNMNSESEADKPNGYTLNCDSRKAETISSANLVSNETSKSNSIANVLRKSFRSLRKTMPSTPASETISKSVSCDIGNSCDEASR